jgi:N-acetylmuramoyl-L-alanine amidase
MRETIWSGVIVAFLIAVLCAACGTASSGPRPAAADSPQDRSRSAAAPDATASRVSSSPAAASGSSGATSGASRPATPPALPLAGKVVGIDPGHNGGNRDAPATINQLVWNGREQETCDTTGTETAGGYTEARFNFNVASDLRADLIAVGARVVMTRPSNTGVGPCVTTRAAIINRAHANVAIDIHADGGPVSGRGFTVLEPVADGPNDKVIGASARFGADVRAAMLADTSMPESNYYGSDGLIERDDLAGLNLTAVPKVLIECGNMPNPVDARLLTSSAFQQELARAFTAAIIAFLTGRKISSARD